MRQRATKVFCVDDHDLVIDGLRLRLEQEDDIEVAGSLHSADGLLEAMKNTGAEIILIDVEMPGPDPFEVISDVERMFKDAKVIVLSAHIRDHYLDEAIKSGAWGYLSKNDDVDELVNAIRRVAKGEFVLGSLVAERCKHVENNGRRPKRDHMASKLETLTPREMQVLRMIGRGLGRKEIADELHRSARTIDNHRASIMRKLNISDRVELVRYAIREGLVEV